MLKMKIYELRHQSVATAEIVNTIMIKNKNNHSKT